MAEYGVILTGYNRKPVPVILAEIEAKMIEVFGAGVVQTAQSPIGQLNGLFADLAGQLNEHAEDVYQSYDPDQAEGVRLDTLGKMRLLERAPDEDDTTLRQAITNAGRARIDIQDLIRAVQNVEGVTYVQVFINDTDATDANGLSGHTVAVAALGGDDIEVALALRAYVVPGIGTSGNTRVDILREGVCRTIWIARPALVPIELAITVIRRSDKLGCPPAALDAIREGLVADMNGDRRLINGEDVSVFAIRSTIEARYPNVEVVSVTGGRVDDADLTMPLAISFNEIADFVIGNITVVNA